MIHQLVEMAKRRRVPGPTEDTSPLYSNLVRRLRQRLRRADPHMDYFEVELNARRLAAWAEDLVKEVANRSLSNIQARKLISINNDIEIDKLISENSDRHNIFVEELPEGSDIESSFVKTGLKVQVNDNEGNKVLVESLLSGDIEKTLVTKKYPDGKSRIWLLQQVTARNPLEKNEDEVLEITESLTKFLGKKKNSMCDEDSKLHGKTKVMVHNTKMANLEKSEAQIEKLMNIKKVLEPIFNSDGPEIVKSFEKNLSKCSISNKSSEIKTRIDKVIAQKKYKVVIPSVNTEVI